MKYQVYQENSLKKHWRWRLIASNNVDKIANSGEGYVNKSDCLHGIKLVKGSADAPVEEV